MLRGLATTVLLSVTVALLVARAAAQDGPGEEPRAAPREAPAAGDAVAYRTRVVGELKSGLAAELRDASLLVALEDRPPASLRRLEARAETDLGRLDKVLRAEGYYGATVDFDIPPNGATRTVTLSVVPGTRYRFAAGGIDYAEAVPPAAGWPLGLADLGIAEGAPARAAVVLAAEATLPRRLRESGRPFARLADRRLVVDHDKHTMEVRFSVAAGPPASFGATRFAGLDKVAESYLRRFIPWTEGRTFDERALETLAARLRGTGLFDAVTVAHAEAAPADGRLPINVTVVERPRRSIGVGGSYSTSEGVGGNVFWEHRNILGEGQKLRASLQAAEIRQRVDLSFRVPDFRRLDQDIVSETALVRQDTDAFKESAGSQTLRLERKVGQAWRIGAGGAYEYSEVTDEQGIRAFSLLGVPAFAERNDADDLLNPTKGSRARLDLTPYQAFGEGAPSFVRSELAGAAYWSPFADFPMVLAGRARLGSILGAETESIPASKRFFAGGGGSIRGYGFQQVGPRDDDNDPRGGRSVVEAGVEARFRVSGPFGLVTFLEAGNVYDDPLPDPLGSISVAAGLGLRYFTSIGPLRADIAFPLDKRAGDDSFQFYISIGQAF